MPKVDCDFYVIDSKENISSAGATVRVPQWVLDEVEAELQKLPRPRPTRGELLAEAWTATRGGSKARSRPGADAAAGTELIPVPYRLVKIVRELIRMLLSKNSHDKNVAEFLVKHLADKQLIRDRDEQGL